MEKGQKKGGVPALLLDTPTSHNFADTMDGTTKLGGWLNIVQPLALAQTAVACLLLLGVYVGYHLLFHPLRALPGPWLARAGLLSPLVVAMAQRRIQFYIRDLHAKYGHTVRYSSNRVSTVHADAAATLYSHKSKYIKSSFYDAFSLFEHPNAFSCRNIQDHSNIRRTISAAFTLTSLLDLEEHVDSCVDDLIVNLDGVAYGRTSTAGSKDGRQLDMAFTFQAFAMDVVGNLAFGQSFGLVQSGKDTREMLASLDTGVSIGSVVGLYGSVSRVINRLLSLLPVPGIRNLQRISIDSVEGRMARVHGSEQVGGEPRKDMLTKLVLARNPVTKEPLSKSEIITHASSIVGAGSDTTSITMRAFFIFVLSNAAVKETLLKEIDTAVSEGSLSFPCAYRDGVKLRYFQACLKETLRLFPAVCYILERIVPANECLQLGEYTIPPGCIVGISPTTYHRQPHIFGPKADQFDPSRWLDSDEQTVAYLERHNLAFGAGSRVCVGKNISLMEMTKALPFLMYRYDFAFTERSPGSPHKMPSGRSWDGEQGRHVPYYVDSSWFSHPKDFFCDVSLRNP